MHLWGVKPSWDTGNTCNESIKWKKKKTKQTRKCESSKSAKGLEVWCMWLLGLQAERESADPQRNYSLTAPPSWQRDKPAHQTWALQSHSPQQSGTLGGLGGVPSVPVGGEGCEVLNLLLCFCPRTTCPSRVPRPTATIATAGWSWWTPSVRKHSSWDTSKSLKYDPTAAPLLQSHLYCLQIINKYIYIINITFV